jgi:hypothetical protein
MGYANVEKLDEEGGEEFFVEYSKIEEIPVDAYVSTNCKWPMRK